MATPLGHSSLSAQGAGKPAESRLSLEEITALLNGATPWQSVLVTRLVALASRVTCSDLLSEEKAITNGSHSTQHQTMLKC